MTRILLLTTRNGLISYLAIAFLVAGNIGRAQSGDGLRYRVNYHCNGERVEVDYCRHDSDMAGFPRTVPQNDYCAVNFPDRPIHNGIMVPSSILRRDIVGQLQACGALPRPLGWAPKQESTVPEVMALANKYFEAKDYAHALEQYQKVLALNADAPTQAMANLKIGFIYDGSNQFDKAIPYLREAARLGPGNGGAFYELGYAYYNLKRYDEALASFQKSVQLLPNDKSARHWLGSAEYATGHMDDALATYRVLQRISPDEASDLFEEITRADLDDNTKKPSAAKRAEAYSNLDIATLLAKANQGDDAAMRRLSDLYYAKKDSASGLRWLIKTAEQGDPDSQNDLGWYYENAPPKNVIAARKWYAKAGEQGFDSADLNLCRSYASQLDLDQGVFPVAGKDDRQSPIVPLRGSQADIDEAFRWCERGGDRGLPQAGWNAGILSAKGSSDRAPNYEDAYFWLTYGGVQAGEVFRQKVGTHLSADQRTELEKLAAAFHPDAMTVLRDIMVKQRAQPK